MKKKKAKKLKSMNVINNNVAGIDIGSRDHYVCVPKKDTEINVRKFGCFTRDLNELADWLITCDVTSVVMESTGVYWIPLYQILESRGLVVCLVNARHVKNVPGRKTDVLDCQWLQRLHSFGLLSASFRPSADICVLRSYVRQRTKLIECSSAHIQRMQKALDQMNIQLHKVISDITGATGTRIIEAILSGERDLSKIAKMRDGRIKCKVSTIEKSLEGDYRAEHIFVLQQEYDLYKYFKAKITECDFKIENHLKTMDITIDPNEEKKVLTKKRIKKEKGSPDFNLHGYLFEITGVDLTDINGLNPLSVMKLLSEVGTDMSRWKTEKHFSSWLGLSPCNKITGSKIKSSRTRKVVNRAANIFRMSAACLANSKCALGAFYRRIRSKRGGPKAITATANKIAKIFYKMLKFGKEFVDIGQDYYEQIYKENIIKNLKKRAKALGMEIKEIPVVT